MPKRLASVLVAAVVVLLFLVAPAGTRVAQGKTFGPPEVAWKDMTIDQKRAYMKGEVLPTMKPLFQAFDPKRFKAFACTTCHGEDGPEQNYKMPGNDTPLPNTPAAFEAKLKSEPTWPKMAKFMAEKVVPTMGKLLAVPVYDPKKPVEGAFSCPKCHKPEAAKP